MSGKFVLCIGSWTIIANRRGAKLFGLRMSRMLRAYRMYKLAAQWLYLVYFNTFSFICVRVVPFIGDRQSLVFLPVSIIGSRMI